MRTDWLTDVAEVIDRVATGWVITILGIGVIVAIVVFKRWRHLFTYLGALFAVRLIGGEIYYLYARPRPYGVTDIGRWSGYSFPAPPDRGGRVRRARASPTRWSCRDARGTRRSSIAAIVLGVVAAAELYLATLHPFDIVVGITLTYAILLNAFRFFTPNDVFPVAYRQGKTAHLDVTGRARRRDPPRRPRPARPHRPRDRAGRARRLGRLHSAAAPRRRRAGRRTCSGSSTR